MKVEVNKPKLTKRERKALESKAFKQKCDDEFYRYIFHFDQGGRHGGLADGRHDWQEGCDNYYDNHAMKGHSSSCRAYAKHGMDYDI